MDNKNILCINSGSSSIKFAMYSLGDEERLIARGAVERIGMSGGWLWLKDGRGDKQLDRIQDFPITAPRSRPCSPTSWKNATFPRRTRSGTGWCMEDHTTPTMKLLRRIWCMT